MYIHTYIDLCILLSDLSISTRNFVYHYIIVIFGLFRRRPHPEPAMVVILSQTKSICEQRTNQPILMVEKTTHLAMFCYNYDVHRLRSKVLPSLLNKFLPSLGELLAEFVSFSIPPKNSTSHLLMIVSCRDAYNEDQWILVSFWFHIRALYHLFVQPPLKKRNKHPVSLLNLTSSQGTSQTFMDTRNATDLATRTSTILDRPSLDVNMCFFVCFFQGRWVSIILRQDWRMILLQISLKIG